MPRTSKCRRVCAEPKARVFTPEPKSGGRVALSVEELEALRGHTLVIEGGHYEVAETGCACAGRCKKCRFYQETQKELSDK